MVIAMVLTDSHGITQEGAIHLAPGPILGLLSKDGVGAWARTPEPGEFLVRYGVASNPLDSISPAVSTRPEDDNTGGVHITGLHANTRYDYESVLLSNPGPTTRCGSFRTLPAARDYIDAAVNPRGLFDEREQLIDVWNVCVGAAQLKQPRNKRRRESPGEWTVQVRPARGRHSLVNVLSHGGLGVTCVMLLVRTTWMVRRTAT